MKAFIRATSTAVPIEGLNINTDQILPARFLKVKRDGGYGQYFFHDLRFSADGREKLDFVLNRPEFCNGRILVADMNYGCGSSREGAVYAHVDYGVVAILAPSFGDIFYTNSLKNGLVPVILDAELLADVRRQLYAHGGDITVDLVTMTVVLPDGSKHLFDLDPFWRECILKGLDEISLTTTYDPQIRGFEESYHAQVPWIRKTDVSLGREADQYSEQS